MVNIRAGRKANRDGGQNVGARDLPKESERFRGRPSDHTALAVVRGVTHAMKNLGRKRPRSKSGTSAPGASRPTEDRAALALTVVWMLTLLASAGAQGVAALLVTVAWAVGPTAEAPSWPAVMAAALMPAAAITGVLCLSLTPLVWRIRAVKPPLTIVGAAVFVGALPLVVWLVLAFR